MRSRRRSAVERRMFPATPGGLRVKRIEEFPRSYLIELLEKMRGRRHGWGRYRRRPSWRKGPDKSWGSGGSPPGRR